MSAEPPDSRGMGWAWKCLNMSDTVWNHKWWTWHCPFSFTDKRKCWEREEGQRERRGIDRRKRKLIPRREGEVGGKNEESERQRIAEGDKVNIWNRQTKTEVRTLSERRLAVGAARQNAKTDTRGRGGSWHFLNTAGWQDVMCRDRVT